MCGGIYGGLERPRTASLWRQNVRNADLRVTAPDTPDSHVIVIVSLDPAARCDLVRRDVGLFLSGVTDLD